MNESFIIALWDIFKEYGDKKQMTIIAERFVDILSEHGTTEHNLEEALGHDEYLDDAIREMLDIEEEEFEEDLDYDDE